MISMSNDSLTDKQRVANYACQLVEDGMIIGLGTGSTANCFIEKLAEMVCENDLKIITVSSSVVSMVKAQELGLEVLAIDQINKLDLYVDGADEVTEDFTLLKGRGSDLVREKLLAKASDQMIVMVDDSKLVQRIGEKYPIPVEVMPFAWALVKASIEDLGGKGELRKNASGDGLAVTSYGSLVLDIHFDEEIDGHSINQLLNSLPGVVEHGVFCGLATTVLVAADGQVEHRITV